MRRLFQFVHRTPRAIDADVEEELHYHLERRTDALVAAGVPADEARRRAVREFGDMDDARRYMRRVDRATELDRRRRDHMSEFRQDIRYALRTLFTARTFTLTALLTLALGIGANTAIFSVVRGVVLRPLPFPDPGQLLKVWSANPGAGALHAAVSPVDLEDWRAQKRQLADIGGYWFAAGGSGIDMTGDGDPVRLSVAFVTPGFFPTLGVQALRGRLPREDEMVRGGDDHVVVLSHAFWRQQFGADPSLVTRTLTLNGNPYTVVGVMPADFRFPSTRVDAFIPYSSIPNSSIPRIRPVRVLDVVARMRPGVSIEQARTELATITARLAQQYPEDAHWGAATVSSLSDAVTGDVRGGLFALLVAVTFVLLMACVNVASLLLARAAAREREVALRVSLGATRGRIVRQMLTESLVLATAGGVIGIGLAAVALRSLLALSAGQLPRGADVRLDGTVLLYAVGVTLLTGIVFGLVPALRAAAPDLQATLREGTHGGGGAASAAQRLRSALVVFEVALSVVLVVGAGLATRSFLNLLHVDTGFRPDHLLAVNFTMSSARLDHSRYAAYYRDVLDRVRALPGVVSAGAVKDAPFRGNGERSSFVPEGMVVPAGEQKPTATIMHASDGYFRTIGAAMVSGREFTPADQPEGPMVVVVNRALARQYFPDRDPVGRRLTLGGLEATIVGVVSDIRQTAIEDPAQPTIYVDNVQNTRIKVTLVARTLAPPLTAVGAVRDAIWSIDREQTITSIFTFDDLVSEAVARPRLLTVLLTVFGALGLVLGAVGIYGVLAYLVAQREREIGVRIALGSSRPAVVRLVVGRGIVLAFAGLVLGTAAAVALTRFLEGVLYGVPRTDVPTYLAVALLTLVVAALASFVPARRAAGVDPVVALRGE